MKTKMVKCCIVAALMIFGSTEVKAQYPAGSYVNQVQFKPYSNQIHYQTYEEAKKQAQQNGYGGYKVDDNNYVNQTAPTQDYLKTSSVNGQSAEGMIDNSGYSSSSSKTTSRSTNNSQMKRDIKAESEAIFSAQKNPTGASNSRKNAYGHNNDIKYGRGR
jgi:hypothetical protein